MIGLLSLMSAAGYLINLKKDAYYQKLSENTLRLHILANSNEVADQEIKLNLRNYVVEKYAAYLNSVHSKKACIDYFVTHKDAIETDLNQYLRDQNVTYTATVSVEIDEFPDRVYEGIDFPAGTYDALRIRLGESVGRNWWCVLYPPLCFVNVMTAIPDQEQEPDPLDTDKIQIKWKFIEWLDAIKEPTPSVDTQNL
jgi:stage II sporulation protein R